METAKSGTGVLAVQGSPRRGGNTETLLEAALQGVRQVGCQVEVLRLNSMRFQACQNCGGCRKTGRCVLEDDLEPVYDRIDRVNRLIVASPVYFYGVTAQTKAFIDRMQAFWSRKYLLRERAYRQQDPARQGVFLSVAASRGRKIFSGAVLEVRYALDAMGFLYVGELLVRGVDARGEMAGRPAELCTARELGAALCRGSLESRPQP